jgi:hypothetical protein
MADDFDKDLRRWRKAVEEGTWREALRAQFAPWFDDLDFGFQVGDGWAEIIRALTTEIAEITGGPERIPRLRVTQAKEKFGSLRFYLRALPTAESEAIDRAIRRAEEKSEKTCERCGDAGMLRQTRGGWCYTACDRHVLD